MTIHVASSYRPIAHSLQQINLLLRRFGSVRYCVARAQTVCYKSRSVPIEDFCAKCKSLNPVVKLGDPGDLRSPPLILDPPHFTRRSLGYCASLDAPFDLFQLFNHRAPHTKL